MYNPLMANPAEFKDAELDNKINELSRKYHIAARSGQGMACQQIIVILESLKYEQQRRRSESLKTSNNGKDSNLDDLININ
jgi:hypothetical protein